MTPEEVARVRRISVKTLANWRSSGTGPAWTKSGGRVVYFASSVMDLKAEIKGQGQQGKPRVTITTRPYPRDKSRQQVDIQLQHPATGSVVRRRLTAPKGMDEAGARSWGEKQVKEILRDLFLAATKEEKTTQTQEPEPKRTKAPTMAELFELYEVEVLCDPEQTKGRTRHTYEKEWLRLKGLFAEVRCDEWTDDHNEKLRRKFRDCGARYHNQNVTLMDNLFKIAVAKRFIKEIPKLNRRKHRSKPKEPAHNKDDIRRLLEAARDVGEEAGEAIELMILLGLDAGLRPGEVAGLRWSDIDWDNNQVMVQNQRPHKMPQNEEYAVKYDESGRIPMTARLRTAMEIHRIRGISPSRYVFVSSKTGLAMYTDLISERVLRAHVRAGLRHKHGHFMRHCAASRVAYAPGGEAADAQGLLRHKNLSTTDTYLREIRGTNMARRAVKLLDLLEEQEDGIEPASTGSSLSPLGTGRQKPRLDLN